MATKTCNGCLSRWYDDPLTRGNPHDCERWRLIWDQQVDFRLLVETATLQHPAWFLT